MPTTEEQQESKTEGQAQSLVPVDLADEYLRARGYLKNGLGLRRHRGEWLRYDGRVFRLLSPEELEADIILYLRGTPARDKSETLAKKIVSQLSATCLIPDSVALPAIQDGQTWSTRPLIVVLQNGVLDLASLRAKTEIVLRPHSPTVVSRVLLPFDYDPQAACPMWGQFLEQILPDPESRALLQEIFGYCLTSDVSQQKFFLFEGTGGNGKGVVTSILGRLLGPENISSLPLDRFHDRHDLFVTYGKLVNFTSELSAGDRISEEQLKRATGEDMMHFNPKFKDPFTGKFTAKIIISTNERPAFVDRSDGIWRRLIVLPFPVTIAPEKQDPLLQEKLAEELPGILNWAIQGAIALYRAGRFREPQVSIEARINFRKESNPAQLFLCESCELKAGVSVGTQKLYEKYRGYCDEHGYKPLNATNFKKEVLKLPGVEAMRERIGGGYPHVYSGVILSPESSPTSALG